MEDTAEILKVEDTAGSYAHRQHSREIHTWRTQQRFEKWRAQQGVLHIDNTAEILKVEDTAGS